MNPESVCVCGHGIRAHALGVADDPRSVITGKCDECECVQFRSVEEVSPAPDPHATLLPSHLAELVYAIDRHTAAMVLVHELVVPDPYNTALRLWAQRTLRLAASANIAEEKERREACPETFVDCTACNAVGYTHQPDDSGTFCLRCAGTGLMVKPREAQEETSDEVQGD